MPALRAAPYTGTSDCFAALIRERIADGYTRCRSRVRPPELPGRQHEYRLSPLCVIPPSWSTPLCVTSQAYDRVTLSQGDWTPSASPPSLCHPPLCVTPKAYDGGG